MSSPPTVSSTNFTAVSLAALLCLACSPGIETNQDRVSTDGANRPSASSESRERLGYGFFRDSDDVYFGSNALEACDPSSFEIIDVHTSMYGSQASWQRDSECVYRRRGSTVSGADPASFVPLSFVYGKDNEYVYHITEVLRGVDPGTFEAGGPFGAWSGSDRHGCYYTGQRVDCADAEAAPGEGRVPQPISP